MATFERGRVGSLFAYLCDEAHRWYATISGRDRPTHRPGFLVPPFGTGRDPHACRLDDPLRGARSPLPRVPRSHRVAPAPGAAVQAEAPLRALRPGPSGVGRRPAPEPRLPRASHLPPGARLRAAASGVGGADLLPAARPLEAALGALADRGPEGRPLRDRGQDPSRDGRRRLRRRHHHGPLRHREGPDPTRRGRPSAGFPRPSRTARSCSARRSSSARSTRREIVARGAQGRARARAAPCGRPPRPSVAAGSFAWTGVAAPRSPFNFDVGPHRRFAWVRASLADMKQVKNELGGTVNDVILAAVAGALGRYMRSRGHVDRRPRAAGDGAGQRADLRPARRARQPGDRDDGAASGLVRGPGAPNGDRPRVDGRPEALEAGDGRRPAHRARRLRAADHRRPGRPPAVRASASSTSSSPTSPAPSSRST